MNNDIDDINQNIFGINLVILNLKQLSDQTYESDLSGMFAKFN